MLLFSHSMTTQSVPFIDLKRFEDGFLDTVSERVNLAIKEAHFVGGPERGSCEEALKNFSQAPFLTLCANGTDALQLALRASGIKAGHKIIVPNLTFWASAEAIINVGATPVVLDIDKESFHLNPQKCLEAFEKFQADGIMLVHLFGWANPGTESIRKFCSDHNKVLVEDSAQAIGVELNGKSLIGTSPLATTSFYPAKVLGASGDAGAVFSTNEEMTKLCYTLADHGRSNHYQHGHVGWNSRVGIYECIFLEESIKHIQPRIESRRSVCQRYKEELNSEHFQIHNAEDGITENGYLSVATMNPDHRERFVAHLKEHNIGHGTVYPTPVAQQPGLQAFPHETWLDGSADQVTSSVVNLPCFAYMTESEQSYVIESVKKFF